MKYKNEDGIELSYTENDVQTKLVKEVVSEAIDILNDVDGSKRIKEAIYFLKVNFDIGDDKDVR